MEVTHLTTTISQKALILIDGKVLLVHGTEEWWELPGGRVDKNETDLVDALKREIKEELSSEVKVNNIFSTYLFKSRDDQMKLVLVYECELLTPKEQIKLQKNEIYGWKLFTKDEIRNLEQIADNSRQALTKFFQD